MAIDLPITALIYTDSAAADRAVGDIAAALQDRDVRLAGLVQHAAPRPGRSRCDMLLTELASGRVLGISQDRGPMARGCALDTSQLLEAMQAVREALANAPDLVILNKFGKTEAEGGGLRPLIADIVEAGLPLLIAVPWRNLEGWRSFAGDFARECDLASLPGDGAALCRALSLPEGKPLLNTGLPGHPQPIGQRAFALQQ